MIGTPHGENLPKGMVTIAKSLVVYPCPIEELYMIVKYLCPHKTGGTNQIRAFIYKILEPFSLNPLTHTVNLSLKSHEFPEVWKKALVIPIFMSGKKSLPNKYRPMSPLPILGKVLDKDPELSNP